MSKRLLTILSLAVIVNLVPPAMALGEEFMDPAGSGCYLYYDGLIFTYWEEDNFVGGLQRDWEKQGSNWIPPDKYHGSHPTFWGVQCAIIGSLEKACKEGCGGTARITV